MTNQFPPTNATREEIARWFKERRGAPDTPCMQTEDVPHEAPPVANGPSIVCSACGDVRVPMTKPFCNGCMGMMAEAGVLMG
jgi:hypothetical protein